MVERKALEWVRLQLINGSYTMHSGICSIVLNSDKVVKGVCAYDIIANLRWFGFRFIEGFSSDVYFNYELSSNPEDLWESWVLPRITHISLYLRHLDGIDIHHNEFQMEYNLVKNKYEKPSK